MQSLEWPLSFSSETFIHGSCNFFAGLLAEPGVTANWRKYQNQSPLQFRHIHKH